MGESKLVQNEAHTRFMSVFYYIVKKSKKLNEDNIAMALC